MKRRAMLQSEQGRDAMSAPQTIFHYNSSEKILLTETVAENGGESFPQFLFTDSQIQMDNSGLGRP